MEYAKKLPIMIAVKLVFACGGVEYHYLAPKYLKSARHIILTIEGTDVALFEKQEGTVEPTFRQLPVIQL